MPLPGLAGFYHAKYWNVATFWQLDDHGIASALARVELGQTASQAGSFAPHDRVLFRVVVRLPSEDFDSNERFFQLDVFAFQMPLNNEAQESG